MSSDNKNEAQYAGLAFCVFFYVRDYGIQRQGAQTEHAGFGHATTITERLHNRQKSIEQMRAEYLSIEPFDAKVALKACQDMFERRGLANYVEEKSIEAMLNAAFELFSRSHALPEAVCPETPAAAISSGFNPDTLHPKICYG